MELSLDEALNYLQYPFDGAFILKKKKSLRRVLLAQGELAEKRVAILSGSTIGEIQDILELFLLSFGIKPMFFVGNYNRYYEDIAFGNEELKAFDPHIIYIHTTVKNILYAENNDAYDRLYTIWERIKADYGCIIIQNNFELPPLGTADTKVVYSINTYINSYAESNRSFYVNDINYLSAYYGLEKWFDAPQFYLYKYALSVAAIPLLAHSAAKIIKSIYGGNGKCLVVDLDNTLWGGVVGEVGVQGIDIGANTAMGEAYADFQTYVKRLHGKGIVLAVCSKNDEIIARAAFDNPNMILALDDFSAFYANWNNKAENIANIAKELNILTDSIVFIDDSEVEQDIVRKNLPGVKVPNVKSVMDFVKYIEMSGYFDNANISKDDMKRNDYYKANSSRIQAQTAFESYTDYLLSLTMTSDIRPFNAENLDRITQLINKTNQFNVTTVRYTYNDLLKISDDSHFVTAYATLSDKFGANGIVSAFIGEIDGSRLHIRLWVMSCRVFKRDLEFCLFDYIVSVCKQYGVETICGYYVKTDKNGFVSGLFTDLGFAKWETDSYIYAIPAVYENKNTVIMRD